MVYQQMHEGDSVMTHRHGKQLQENDNDTNQGQTTQIIEHIELGGGSDECIQVTSYARIYIVDAHHILKMW